MAVTVADIVGEPSLRVRGVAGESGFDRVVSWAATCEMANPWDWLDAGDLLLVNGHGIPSEPAKQELFIRNLNQAGMAGLGVADHAFSPELGPAMHDACDELGFPLLSVDYEVAFSSISKTVARWNHSIDQHSVRLTARIYDRMRKDLPRAGPLPTSSTPSPRKSESSYMSSPPRGWRCLTRRTSIRISLPSWRGTFSRVRASGYQPCSDFTHLTLARSPSPFPPIAHHCS